MWPLDLAQIQHSAVWFLYNNLFETHKIDWARDALFSFGLWFQLATRRILLHMLFSKEKSIYFSFKILTFSFLFIHISSLKDKYSLKMTATTQSPYNWSQISSVYTPKTQREEHFIWRIISTRSIKKLFGYRSWELL